MLDTHLALSVRNIKESYILEGKYLLITYDLLGVTLCPCDTIFFRSIHGHRFHRRIHKIIMVFDWLCDVQMENTANKLHGFKVSHH